MLDRLNVYLNNRPKTKITSKPLTNDTSIKRVDVFPRVRHWRYGTQSNIRGARHSGKSHTCTLYVSGLDAFPSTPCCSTTQSATQVACRHTHAPAANSDQTVTVLRWHSPHNSVALPDNLLWPAACEAVPQNCCNLQAKLRAIIAARQRWHMTWIFGQNSRIGETDVCQILKHVAPSLVARAICSVARTQLVVLVNATHIGIVQINNFFFLIFHSHGYQSPVGSNYVDLFSIFPPGQNKP